MLLAQRFQSKRHSVTKTRRKRDNPHALPTTHFDKFSASQIQTPHLTVLALATHQSRPYTSQYIGRNHRSWTLERQERVVQLLGVVCSETGRVRQTVQRRELVTDRTRLTAIDLVLRTSLHPLIIAERPTMRACRPTGACDHGTVTEERTSPHHRRGGGNHRPRTLERQERVVQLLGVLCAEAGGVRQTVQRRERVTDKVHVAAIHGVFGAGLNPVVLAKGSAVLAGGSAGTVDHGADAEDGTGRVGAGGEQEGGEKEKGVDGVHGESFLVCVCVYVCGEALGLMFRL